jgi:hypothetical protein
MDSQEWKSMCKYLGCVLFFSIFLQTPLPAAELKGTINGLVVDQATQQPLPGANLVLLDLKIGTTTGADGRFVLAGVPLSNHRIRVSMIGYKEHIRADVIVRSGRITTVEIQLSQQVLDMRETVIEAGYFSAPEEKSVSAIHFSHEEIRRSPGSAQDISRLLQALPSINMNNDQRNDLIVRGGSPSENLTLIDHIEIPNINHFPTQGASGGPIGLLNIDLISATNFHAGGFSSAYGDRLSSVLAIDLREGNRDEFDGEFNLGMAGAGFVFEGPLRRGRGAWVISTRRSYLDLIVGAIGTGAVPEYSDIQGKLSYDLGPAHRLSLLSISGFDHIDIAADDQDENEDNVVWNADQHVLGTSWKWLWSPRGYATTSLAYSYTDFAIDVTEDPSLKLLYQNDAQEREIALRSNFHYSPRPGRTFSWGVAAKRIFSDFGIFAAADTNRVNASEPELRIQDRVETSKAGLYLMYEHYLSQRLQATLGMRYDYFAYNQESDLAPRLALSYDLDAITSLHAAWGLYYQNLPASLLVQHSDNRVLENPRADHWVLGLKRRLTPSTQLSLEVYLKNYTELPYDPDDPTLSVVDAFADFGAPAPGRLIGGGKASSRGAELLLQKKLAQALYGTASYSYSVSRYTDLEGVERDRNFDNRHLFSLILGYRPSDKYEFSVRWRYAGGRPYTPYDEELSTQFNNGIIQKDRLNSERYSAYHRLDLRFDHRKHYQNFNIVSFFSLLNAYNRANIFSYYWEEDEDRVGRIDQWSILPIGGFEVEF